MEVELKYRMTDVATAPLLAADDLAGFAATGPGRDRATTRIAMSTPPIAPSKPPVTRAACGRTGLGPRS